MEIRKLEIIFASEELRKAFIGWFLDGGGEQYFYDSVANRDSGLGMINYYNYDKANPMMLIVDSDAEE